MTASTPALGAGAGPTGVLGEGDDVGDVVGLVVEDVEVFGAVVGLEAAFLASSSALLRAAS